MNTTLLASLFWCALLDVNCNQKCFSWNLGARIFFNAFIYTVLLETPIEGLKIYLFLLAYGIMEKKEQSSGEMSTDMSGLWQKNNETLQGPINAYKEIIDTHTRHFGVKHNGLLLIFFASWYKLICILKPIRLTLLIFCIGFGLCNRFKFL